MKSKSIKIILPCMMLLAFSHISLAQVSIALTQPPSEKWNIESLWNLTLTNLSANPQNVYLFGTVEEMNKGMIVECTTSAFIIAANYIGTVSYVDLLPVDINYIGDENYQEIYVQTNSLPAGTYTICVYVKDVKTATELAKDCYVLYISHPSPPELIIPTDKAEISEAYPNFLWLPTISTISTDINYTLKVVELLDEQIPYEAMESNLSWFKEKGISLTSFQYPISARQMEAGKSYAWQVTAFSNNHEIGESEVFTFEIAEEEDINIEMDSLTVGCCINGYQIINFTIQNTYDNNDTKLTEVKINGVNENFAIPYPMDISSFVSPSLPYSYLPSFLSSSEGRMNFTATIPCIENMYTLALFAEGERLTNNGLVSNSTVERDTLNCNCCDNFITEVDSLNVSQTNVTDPFLNSLGSYQLSGVFTAGPNPICKIQAEMLSYTYHTYSINNPPNAENICTNCIWPSSKYGNFKTTISSVGSLSPTLTTIPPYTYSREIIWEGEPCNVNQIPFYITLLLPDAIPLTDCCKDLIGMCIKFSFTDTDCVTCDTVRCFKISRSPFNFQVYNENSWKNKRLYPPLIEKPDQSIVQINKQQEIWRIPGIHSSFDIPKGIPITASKKYSNLLNK